MTTIVMTGATSGLGRVAAQRLAARPGVRVIAGARGGGAPDGVETRPLDLASLAAVRAFADGLAGVPIDALVLNAGMQVTDPAARTVDGFETTFAVNHLAHYLLLRRLAGQIVPGGRVVITSSGTHDPAERTGMPPPRHADAARLADPASDPDRDAAPSVAGRRAYTASKLANLMTARAFAARAPGLTVLAYDPGLTPGTGLARDYPWALRTLVWPLLGVLRPFIAGVNTAADAGRGLADLASDAVPPAGHVYAALRRGRLTWPQPSLLARDDAAVARLWDDCARLVGEA